MVVLAHLHRHQFNLVGSNGQFLYALYEDGESGAIAEGSHSPPTMANLINSASPGLGFGLSPHA